jgi:periplasmic divalent cation tolerance protein
MAYCFVYVTTPTLKEARDIGRAAVEQKLAACANVLPQMESIYHWGGDIEESKECVLILKTKENLFGKVRDFVLSQHSYDCPCVVSLPVKDGSAAFLKWIENNVQ